MNARNQAVLTANLTGQPLRPRYGLWRDLLAAGAGVVLAGALVLLAAAIARCT